MSAVNHMVRLPRRAARSLPVLFAAHAVLAAAAPAAAQQPPAPPATRAAPTVEPSPGKDLLAAALAPTPGGLTADEVAKAAARTRQSVRVKQAELRAAAARVDQALVGYFPRVTVTATYTRLSPVDNALPGALVGAQNPSTSASPFLTTGPCPGGGGTCVLDSGGQPLVAQPLAFPSLVNSYSVVGSLSVPISDYLLRITQAHAGARHAHRSKKLEVEAEILQVSADARVAFFNWVRAKGQVAVAQKAVEAARQHVGDAKKTFEVGLLSRADVLRLEAQLAAAEQVEAEAEALEAVAAEQLRIVIGAPPTKPLAIGSDVMNDTAQPSRESLATLQDTAFARRLEIKALDEAWASSKEQESLARAGAFPRLDGFANVTVANPNQRIFPSQDQWDATWDLGLRLTWTVNDTFTGLAATAEARARTASVAEQRALVRDALRLEVTNAFTEGRKAGASTEAADRGLKAAEESLRVRRELFRNGKATSVDLIDAETEVTRARLRRLDAHVGLLVARARLDHAVGRDIR
jgi:outer membrane protein TolC